MKWNENVHVYVYRAVITPKKRCKCVIPDTYACHVWLNENGQLNLPEWGKKSK